MPPAKRCPRSALAFLIVGSPPANAFGSEVLGCSFDSAAWTANSCGGGGDSTVTDEVYFAPHNLSGSYTTMTWTVKGPGGSALGNCTGSTPTVGCISAGCTSGAIACDITVHSSILRDRIFTASLKLTQSGQTRTISATADAYRDTPVCLTC